MLTVHTIVHAWVANVWTLAAWHYVDEELNVVHRHIKQVVSVLLVPRVTPPPLVLPYNVNTTRTVRTMKLVTVLTVCVAQFVRMIHALKQLSVLGVITNQFASVLQD
jgi:hypothetical protein